jgi:hypothetical protein
MTIHLRVRRMTSGKNTLRRRRRRECRMESSSSS